MPEHTQTVSSLSPSTAPQEPARAELAAECSERLADFARREPAVLALLLAEGLESEEGLGECSTSAESRAELWGLVLNLTRAAGAEPSAARYFDAALTFQEAGYLSAAEDAARSALRAAEAVANPDSFPDVPKASALLAGLLRAQGQTDRALDVALEGARWESANRPGERKSEELLEELETLFHTQAGIAEKEHATVAAGR